MNNEVKIALSKVLKVFQNDKSWYNPIPDDCVIDASKFTSQGVAQLAFNHLFDDRPALFGISKFQGHQIRGYFSRCDGKNQVFMNELYKEFPGIFEGEFRQSIDNIIDLDKNIPLFENNRH